MVYNRSSSQIHPHSASEPRTKACNFVNSTDSRPMNRLTHPNFPGSRNKPRSRNRNIIIPIYSFRLLSAARSGAQQNTTHTITTGGIIRNTHSSSKIEKQKERKSEKTAVPLWSLLCGCTARPGNNRSSRGVYICIYVICGFPREGVEII